ncbi:MAG: aminopeptidase P family protein [Pseudomonadota bacterium]
MFQSFTSMSDRAAGPVRLAALREEMARRGVQGFLIPRGDAHQGETVAPRDERLAWLTGFTGSAGFAAALAERAAVFVDGRYDLQVKDQVDGDAYERLRIETTKPADWLKDAVRRGDRIAYDPWLHGRDEAERLRRALEGAGAELVATENLVDAVWPDQPEAPQGAIMPHPAALAGEESAEKRARLAEGLRGDGVAAAALTLPDSLAWLLNIRGSDVQRRPIPQGFGLLHEDGRATLFCAPAKVTAEARAHLGNEVATEPTEAFGPALDGLAGKRVRVDRASAPDWVARRLEAAGAEVVWGEDPCLLPKARKNAAELAGTEEAHLRDGASMVRFLRWVDETAPAGGLTEIDVVTALERFRAEGGDLKDISFDTICGAGPNGAIVHYRVTEETNRALTPGDVLLVDSGGQYQDGTTDITRTLATGPADAPAPAEAVQAATLVLKGMIAISRARWPAGLAGRDLDALARIALWRAGLDYDHGTGHGVGVYLGTHEGPQNLSRRSHVPLEPGMILSNEPGCYRPGEWGIRIENLVAIEPPSIPEGGEREMLSFRTLTWCPIDRRLIDAALLDAEERAWLDAYHARTLAKLAPRLSDPADLAWLEAACAPL